jgi:hypothetical protein
MSIIKTVHLERYSARCSSSLPTKLFCGGSFDPDQNKTPVAVILDEAHQYYVSDFVIPFYTGTRKHNVGIKIFSQSCNNFPPNDIDIFLATAAHLVAFGIGSKDAAKIASDILLPRNNDMVKSTNYDIYGPYSEMNYYSIAEQREHAVAEIEGVPKVLILS